jgi:hypothetical protein
VSGALPISIMNYYLLTHLLIILHTNTSNSLQTSLLEMPKSPPSIMASACLYNNLNNGDRQLPKNAYPRLRHLRQVFSRAMQGHRGTMRAEADLNRGPNPRLDQLISPLGTHPLGTGQRVHHQIPRILPKQGGLPQHSHGLRRGRRSQSTHPLDQTSRDHPPRRADPEMVHTDVPSHQARPRQKNHPSRPQSPEHIPHRVRRSEIRGFRHSQAPEPYHPEDYQRSRHPLLHGPGDL